MEKALNIKIEYFKSVNYALVHNHIRVCQEIVLENKSKVQLKDFRLKVCGDYVKETYSPVYPMIDAGAQLLIKDLEVKPEPSSLASLSERVTSCFTIKVLQGDEEVHSQDFEVDFMAFDQWLGSSIVPQCLASFVMPNINEVKAITLKAASVLKEMTGSSSFVGYQSGNPNDVLKQVGAVFKALHKENIVYRSLPASFETVGQRITLPDEVLRLKLANCIELTILMASVLESIGINPIVILVNGHAFLGVWLVEDSYAHSMGDDPSFLEKKCSIGISEIAVIECTEIAKENTSFENACNSAEQKLSHLEQFVMFLDIHRCRLEHYLPLPMRTMVDGKWNIDVDGVEHGDADVSVKHHTRYDLEKTMISDRQLSKLDIWERKLLDFSLRNTMLNLKFSSKAVQFISFDIDRIEDYLSDGAEYCLREKPEMQFAVESNEKLFRSKQFPELKELIANDIDHNTLHSYQSAAETKTVLKSIYRSARTAIEETGANSLYLAIGVLRWYETEVNEQPRYAPILLLPIEMVYKKGNYYIRTRDEEITLNVTLVEFLRQNYDIDIKGLDKLPRDEHGVDVSLIFAMLRECLKEQQRWDVEEECLLGIFSFNKFVMWNDIHSHHNELVKNHVVESLVEGKLTWQPTEMISKLSEMDKSVSPADMAIPVPVDSSQMSAVCESANGHSFILYGPPGTGKSQTITNVIANALYHGKRVLFVAEKMAALSVVQNRLAKIGLEPFCLELHSNKVTKRHILEQLNKALSVTHIQKPAEYQKTANALFEQRMKLIQYMEAIHNVGADGFSLYDCVVRYESLKTSAIDIASTESLRNLSASTIKDYEYKLGSPLITVIDLVGQPSSHPLHDLIVKKEVLQNQADFVKLLQSAVGLVEKIIIQDGIEAVDSSMQLVASIHKAEEISGADLRFLFDGDNAEEINDYCDKTSSLNCLKSQILSTAREEILTQDALALSMQWHEIQGKWFLPRFFASRSFIKKLRFFAPNLEKDKVQELLENLISYHKQLKECNDLQPKIVKAISSFIDAVKVKSIMQRWITNAALLKDWYHWCEYRRELLDMNLDDVVRHIESNTIDAQTISDAFFKGYFKCKSNEIIAQSELLSTFEGKMFDEKVKRYKNLTNEFQELSKKELYARLAANVPRLTDNIDSSSEVGFLNRNISNGGRGVSIRDLFDQIPTLLPRLCPCMLMSPMSVAQYINIGQKKFDLVIFDEASQMPTSESVGAIARGEALVVVGDPKQMPPTSFFSTSNVNEDEADIDDMESILEDCRTLGIPSLQLSWHYRSRHESLISFSNNEYYDGSLITFPSTDDKQTKVNYIPIKGYYDKGKKRNNKAEAEAIVKEIERRLLDPELRKYSIGVIAFSVVQQTLIDDMLSELLESNKQLSEFAESMYEPIFIKNLENVQGDERDVILFSIGYGPDKDGHVSMNFGPLNNAGGERRLNVAVSRARHQMMVFSTLKSSDIDLRRTNATGVEGLKHFLEYAERQSLVSIPANMQSANDSLIASEIGEALKQRGYDVQFGIGRSQFKIDIAIVDKDNPDSYRLGILLDGEQYKQTQTTRDREIVQPSVLESLAWRVMRVWTVDWINNRSRVIERILKLYEEAPLNVVEPVSTPTFDISNEKEEEFMSDAQLYTKFDSSKTYVDLRSAAKAIVKAEQPIKYNLLSKRVANAMAKERITPTMQKELQNVVKSLYSVADGDSFTYYTSEEDFKKFTGYRSASGRTILEIPLVEIENALIETIGAQVSLSEDSAMLISAKKFGYARRGANVDQALVSAINHLVDVGTLVRENGKVKLANYSVKS